MKRTLSTFALATLMAAVTPRALMAQSGSASGPATNTAELTPGPLLIKVTGTMGGAQYRLAGQTKWQAVKAGDELAEGAEIRTGPKGAVQFTIGTDQVYRVDRLTVVRLLRAALVPDGTIHTDVGMQYGRVSKDVDSPVRPHEDTIVTPSSTLAVRGTRVSLFDQPPFEPEAVSLTGAAVFSSLGKQLSAFGAHGQGTASVSVSHPDASEKQISGSATDPMPAASLTASEQVVEQNVSGQGKVSAVLNNVPSLPVDALPPPTDAELKTLTPGGLVFYIRWNTDTPVEMELTVHAGPKNAGEFIFPVLGLDRSPAGGQILFSNPGTATGGYEVITYPATFPIGAYTINAINVGTIATTVTFNAFTSKNGVVSADPFFANLNNIGAGTVPQPTALLLPGITNNVPETTQIPPLPNLSGIGIGSLGNLAPTAAAAIARTAPAVARPTRSAQISNPVTLTIHRPM